MRRALYVVLVLCGVSPLAYAQYHAVALRVEFQPDTTRYTTGDGTFDGLRWPSGLTPKVDPLPHDAAYFEAHLAFLEDYIRKVSDGQADVNTLLLPEIVRVGQPMGAYSPTGEGADTDVERSKLVRLLEEAWETADASIPVSLSHLDPGRIFFALFHAGIGRDVELLGTVLEKTPQDLPSLYFGAAELARLGSGRITYGGVPVSNSAIIPRTESRPGYNSILQDSLLLELSINGLLASSFFSFLGIPDLFNTATGETAIGGFGLMDPHGIFAYAGLFPPAPTAWTRQRLGWLEPQQLTGSGPLEVTLMDGDAARADISSAEYFLIENRQRDPQNDGLVMQVWQEGQVVIQQVESIRDDFNRFTVDGFTGGVVVGVDDYDFALPGRDADGVAYPGGILVWHVDERIIQSGQVNARPDHRGLDLEEADAAQDLGYGNSPGGPFDFFYEGNDVRAVLPSGREIRFYENRFGPATMPSSEANDGGESFITLADFSMPGPSMTFTYMQQSAHGIAPLADVDMDAVMADGSSSGGGQGFSFAFSPGAPSYAVVVVDGSTYTVSSLARPIAWESSITVLQSAPAPGEYLLKTIDIPGMNVIREHQLRAASTDYAAKGPLVASEDGALHALFSDMSASTLLSVSSAGVVEEKQFPGGATQLARSPDNAILVVGSTYVAAADGSMLWQFTDGGAAAFATETAGIWGVVSDVTQQHLLFLEPGGHISSVDATDYAEGALFSGHVTLADIDADGSHEVITTAGEYLLALERSGAMVLGFPVHLGAPLVGQPLVASRGQSEAMIVVASSDGLVFAIEGGQVVSGFPLSVGPSISGTPRLTDGRLEVATSEGVLRAYALESTGDVLWGEQYQGWANTSFAMATATQNPPPTSRLLVASETYNWPNPVRDGKTRLRLMTEADAQLTISIVDMAGTLVHEISGEVRGGTPSEFLWEAAVESGIYFARIHATSPGGRADTRLVRIAVIR